MSHDDTWGNAFWAEGTASERTPSRRVACLRSMLEEASVAGTSEGDSGRRGAWRGNGGPHHGGTCRASELGFSSERNGEPVEGWEQRNGMIRFTF